MYGPQPQGHWTSSGTAKVFQHLQPGQRYEVAKPFLDHDGDQHPVGERWTYLGYAFLPHDDGLSLFLSLDGQSEWHMRLQWRADEQGPIIDDLKCHIRQVG
jgi:hypothetical protein